MDELKGKKIVMIIASEGYRDEELNVPLAFFKKRGADITIASSSLKTAKGTFGATAKPDILFSDIDVKNFDAIVFIGGTGSSEYWNDPKAHKIAKEAVSSGKVLAAICIAPATLANAGVLTGKKATVFPSEEAQLVSGGATYTAKGVEVDDKIVTANGPQNAEKFAEEIAKLLKK